MRKNLAEMQAQLERVQGRNATPQPPLQAPKQGPDGRAGKAHIGAYLDPGFRKSLRMVHAQTDRDLQQLLSEALNDLFRKYNVPVIGHD